MSVPDIRPLQSKDLGDAVELSTTCGWNQLPGDWQMLLRLAPRGCFAARDGQRLVGTSIGIDYGGFGWIAMMLVAPDQRRRGLGRRLLDAAITAVPDGLPIRLDATPAGRALYLRHGFQDISQLTRYVAESPFPRADRDRLEIRRLSTDSVSIITAHDPIVFGADRSQVLDWADREAPQYVCLARADDRVPQYCLGRPGRRFDQLGPVVARDVETARALVAAAVEASAGRPLVVDAFDANASFLHALLDMGFCAERTFTRMERPGSGKQSPTVNTHDRPLVEFAILGPEFG